MMRDLQISAVSSERLKGRLVVASLSGGKDSTALAEVTRVCTLGHPNACSMGWEVSLDLVRAPAPGPAQEVA